MTDNDNSDADAQAALAALSGRVKRGLALDARGGTGPRKFQSPKSAQAPQAPEPAQAFAAPERALRAPEPPAQSDRDTTDGYDDAARGRREGKSQVRAKRNAGKGAGRKPKAVPQVVEVAPMAPRASMRRRHWGLVLSFILFVLAPIVASGWYLWTISTDQYASTVGFTVRQEEGGSGSDMLGSASLLLGGSSTQSDTDILYEFIQSQEMVARIDARLDLRGHYAQVWPQDRAFGLWPEATIEDLLWYWGRVVSVSYDQSSGLLELRILAFDGQMAQRIGNAILDESQRMINALNEQARTDSIGYAREDLEGARARLKTAREALILFRTRTQIVDPETDLQGRLVVVNNLQQQLAEALVELDVLRDQSTESDPRIKQARRRIEVIRNRIAVERKNVASGDEDVVGDSYPMLLAEYEGLLVDREFAEEGYRAALTALDIARTNAQRQSRYLAAYVRPTLPQTAEYPRRFVVLGLVGLFVLLVWSIMALIYYSVRDSR